jgi:hypothetical protein
MNKILPVVTLLILSFNSLFSQTLLHYWNFNTTTSLEAHLAPSYTVGGGTLAYAGGSTGTIDLAGGTGQDFSVANLNARNGDVSGNHLRNNLPIGSTLSFSLPTTGYSNVVFKYATRRSGSGAGTQHIEYSTNGSDYTLFTTINPVDGAPTLQTLDFSSIPATDNNPDFKIRISFSATGGGTAGNNRFDNVTLDGTSAGTDILAPTVSFTPAAGATLVDVNTNISISFNEDIRTVNDSPVTSENVDGMLILKLGDVNGADIPFEAEFSNNIITISPSAPLSNNQQYYVALKPQMVEDLSGNAVASAQSASFTTVPLQTTFNPGELLLVAYQMNAVPNEDRIAFVTLVNILPGTNIIFTDSKYTTNATPQCPNGITWTAPSTGVTAGTVVTINNDAGTASTGTVTGSTFGLSANGDQVIVYSGTATSPSFITALSSNAWVPGNTSCSGSFSALPASLTDGISSINLSTAPGNVSGNTVNAYYNGSMIGTIAELKASITNPANWIGTASGTPAQTWPNWAFPGPPVVTEAKLINATTIRIIFNRDLDPVSAVNPANFTGITGLASITRTENGALKDTVTLSYSTPFATGSTNTLTVSGVKDSENRTMAAPYIFSFTYNTSISFNTSAISVNENAGQISLQLNLSNPSASSVKLVVKGMPFSTASASDFTLSTQELQFTGESNSTQLINIPVNDDALAEQDEYFVITLEDANGLSVTGSKYATIFIRDNDKQAPVPGKQIELEYIGSYDPSGANNASSEIVVYDSASKRLFVISALQNRLDIADFTNPASIQPVTSVDMTPYGGITSVAVKNGIVAAAAPNIDQQQNGSVVFFNTDGVFQKQVTVGALPDMITFTPDGKYVMTANEGQPNDSYTVDPEGSVSIIDVSGGLASVSQSSVVTAGFTAFNAQEATLIAAGVRKGYPNSTLSQDLEPEYISISPDSKTAWVILQEANSFAVIDLLTKSVTAIWPLGKKDHNIPGNGFDASDRSSSPHIANWPVKGLYMPDGIANYQVNGTTYIVGANEGDDREYSAFNERLRVNDPLYKLDSTVFPNAQMLKDDNNLGRLRVTKASGDTDGDGDFDEIHLIGGRSFSIWNTETKSIVYDSKDDFEQYLLKTPKYTPVYNADHESNTPRARSTSKGPEPEGLVLAQIAGKHYAFVSLERQGGVMVYDITDPANAKFVDYNNPRDLSTYGGDNGPEGIFYISNKQSPDGNHYIVVANEVSGSLSIYKIKGNISTKPEVAIVSPMNNATYAAGKPVQLRAIANDADGIHKLEFYNSGSLFLTDSIAPYEIMSMEIEPGTYYLTAKAFDNTGDSAVSDTVKLTVTSCTPAGYVIGEGFLGIPGAAVTDLTGHPSFPADPTVAAKLVGLEYGYIGDYYGARIRGYICAPRTGNYTFYISSDDQSEFWLSTDDDPAHKVKLAYVNGVTPFRSYFVKPSQRSVPVRLIRGARYYFEIFHKEHTHADHLSVAWTLPGGANEAPIPGSRLSPYEEVVVQAAGNNSSNGQQPEFAEAMRAALGFTVKASPNPTTTQFILTTQSDKNEKLSVVVTDVLGRIVERRNNIAANGVITLGSNYRSGIYFVQVRQGTREQKLKLVKQ